MQRKTTQSGAGQQVPPAEKKNGFRTLRRYSRDDCFTVTPQGLAALAQAEQQAKAAQDGNDRQKGGKP